LDGARESEVAKERRCKFWDNDLWHLLKKLISVKGFTEIYKRICQSENVRFGNDIGCFRLTSVKLPANSMACRLALGMVKMPMLENLFRNGSVQHDCEATIKLSIMLTS
jgi:hypothetical protein